MMLVASDPVGFVPAPKRRLPPPLLASPCPVARDPASPLARACGACGRTARPVCSWRGVRSRQAGAGMMGSMTRWSCPSPSPAARRFRERSCRPSLPLPCDLRGCFAFGFYPLGSAAVRPSGRQVSLQERSSTRLGLVERKPWIYRGFGGSLLPPLASSAVFDGQKLRPGTESRKKFQMQLCTGRRRPGG